MTGLPHLLLALVAGCGGEPAPSLPAPAPTDAPEAPSARLPDPSTLPDVVLITLDTTRADRLGSYGYPDARTDTLDALAARGTRYARAYSPLPLTIPSHATMFTGLLPPEHGIRTNSDQILGEEQVTLAERLQEAGYRTGASVAAFVTTRKFGFSQGFEAYYDDIPKSRDVWHAERPARQVVDDILAWEALDAERPRFAWVHLYDAHYPYEAEPEYVEATAKRPYDAELAMIDDQVARLVEAFGERPTLFVVIGDHGEGLGEHQELAHGLRIYNSTQHVPWFMAGPGVPQQVVDAPVSLADLSPTLLDLLGLPPLDGVSGRPAAQRGDAPIYMEAYDSATRFGIAPPVGVVQGRHKLVALPRPELYDVVADPNETRDLAATDPARVAELAGHLAAWSFPPPKGGSTDIGGADQDIAAQLAALGYVEGGMEFDPDAVLPDPKDRLDFFERFHKVDGLSRRSGASEELVDELRSLHRDYPEVVELYMRLSRALRAAGRAEEARAVVEAGLVRAPNNLTLLLDHANDLVAEKRFDEASVAFQDLASRGLTQNPRLRLLAVAALFQARQPEQALQLAHTYLTEHPDDHHLAGFMGVQLVGMGSFKKALELLERGILAPIPERDVAFHLAAAATGRGDIEQASALLEKEVKHHPTNAPAVLAWGRMLLVQQRPGDVLEMVKPRLERFKESPDLYWLAAQAHYNLGQYATCREVLDAGLALGDAPAAELLMLDANLLKQEGKPEAAQRRFEEALARREAERSALKEPPPRGPVATP